MSARVESCQTKAIALLLLVFLGGVGTGVLGTRVYSGQAQASTAEEGHAHNREELTAQLRSELALEPAQSAEVEAILDECIMMEADLLYQIRNLKADGRERILKVLNDDQKAKFQTLLNNGVDF